jgi:hypothetical protein
MGPTADEKPNESGRRALEGQATLQLTTLTSLLAGFLFDWLTSLVDKELSTPFSLALLVVTVLTILVLVLASIVGALLTIASEIAIREGPLRNAQTLWVLATKAGIFLFLITIALLPYRVSLVGGVISSVLAAGMAITVFASWSWIQRFSRPGSGRGGGQP